ncbi:MAG TPA: DEAD/DEAH box helicase family protein [Acidimicrobiales bacterium]|nr:DEAD/DEAH box helicase family protein [Acidimicrobiales bacterium]
MLGQHVGDVVARALVHVPVSRRIEAINQLLLATAALVPQDVPFDLAPLAPGPALLLEILSDELGARPTPRPKLALRRTDLFVNARGEPQLARELEAEIHSATSVDLLCAFLKWSGVVLVRDALRTVIARRVPVRVLTTTYMGATEQRAIDELVRLGAQVSVSYETHRTRLHAKAWLFRRRRQLDTAYVGSSNLSRAAMTEGLEWNVRLSRAENAPVLDKFGATFDAYWNSGDFDLYDPVEDGDRLRAALTEAGSSSTGGATVELPDLDVRPYPFQQEILDRLEAERTVHDRWHNLVVAATGTGKTVVAGLDYKRLPTWPRFQPKPTLLFVAHRGEILRQSRMRFRQILKDPTFGELMVGGEQPKEWQHVFASVQSLANVVLDRLPADRFDVVIVDEFHHAEAPTYRRLLSHLRPQCLLGLTATPERSDGLDVRSWFDGQTAAELRLWEALERDLLCPFHYFVAYDGVDVASIEWKRGGYDVHDLDRLYTGNDARAGVVLRELLDKTADASTVRALGFCVSVAHAEFMARFTNATGLHAVALSGSTPADDRADALRRLQAGDLQVIYSVDLFNEGLDLPQIDTVLLLRPTSRRRCSSSSLAGDCVTQKASHT